MFATQDACQWSNLKYLTLQNIILKRSGKKLWNEDQNMCREVKSWAATARETSGITRCPLYSVLLALVIRIKFMSFFKGTCKPINYIFLHRDRKCQPHKHLDKINEHNKEAIDGLSASLICTPPAASWSNKHAFFITQQHTWPVVLTERSVNQTDTLYPALTETADVGPQPPGAAAWSLRQRRALCFQANCFDFKIFYSHFWMNTWHHCTKSQNVFGSKYNVIRCIF